MPNTPPSSSPAPSANKPTDRGLTSELLRRYLDVVLTVLDAEAAEAVTDFDSERHQS